MYHMYQKSYVSSKKQISGKEFRATFPLPYFPSINIFVHRAPGCSRKAFDVLPTVAWASYDKWR